MSHNPDTIEPFSRPLDSVAANQRDEEHREAQASEAEQRRARWSRQNGDNAAFPLHVPGEGPNCGLTKREHIAALALQGIIIAKTSAALLGAQAGDTKAADGVVPERCAAAAVAQADALLYELEKLR